VYYLNWTALQRHVRTVHPPTCHFASCRRRTFTKQAGLRAHLKLHEQYGDDPEQARGDDADYEENTTDTDEHPRKRLRRGDLGRNWKCQEEDCDKDFTSVSLIVSF
jgi:general transcription factor IIIA